MNHSKSNNPMKRFLLSVALVLSSLAVALSQTHFVPVFPGHGVDHMNFYAMTATIDGVALQAGDEIAVFDATYCVGVAVVVSPGVMLSVPASKDDPVTVGVVDGYRTGNPATFKMWDASSNIEVSNINVTLVGGSLSFDAGTSAFVNLAGTSPAAENTAPVVSDIPNQSIPEGSSFSTITLDNYVTDLETPDANILWGFSGNSNLAVSIVNRVATITNTNPDWNGTETITFTATDDDATNPISDADDAIFTVTPVNDPPVITGQSTLSVNEETALTLVVGNFTISDVDNPGGPFTLTVQSGSNYVLSGTNRITPSLNYNGPLTVPVTVSDGSLSSSVFNTLVTVLPVNDYPHFISTPGIASVNAGTFYSFIFTASDVDGDPITWSAGNLPGWLSFNNETHTVSGTPQSVDVGDYTYQIYIDDGHGPVHVNCLIHVLGGSNKLVFTTSIQTLYTGFASDIITLEVQDATNNPVNVTSNTTIQLTTSSAGGTFSSSQSSWVAVTTVTIPSGSSNVSFYYKDNTAGTPIITAAESPDQGWTNATQQHVVEVSSISHAPHSVGGSVRTSTNTIPVSAQLTFNAYITSRPGEVLTKTSTGCGYSGGYFWVQCATTSSGWAAGETMHFDFADAGSGEVGSVDVTLSNNSSDDAGLVVLASLQPPVITAISKTNIHDLTFTLEALSGMTTYRAYRDTVAFFTPDKSGGANRVANNITDGDPGTPGVQWTDVNVVGYANKNYYYIFTEALGNNESGNSITNGKFDYNLVVTPTTDFNEIALPLNIENITNAAELMALIPGCNSVARWNASLQGYEQYISFIPPTNFDVEMGYPYYVNVTGNAVFTLMGEIADPTFDLVTTATTDFNEVMLTLDKTVLTTASELMTDIPFCNSIARWNAALQGYEQYISFIPPTNFGVRVGYPYYVNVTSNTTWPENGGGKKNAPNAGDIRIEKKGAPHLIFGKIAINDASQNESDISFTAYPVTRQEDKLTQNSAGCMLKDGFWVVQCNTFGLGWKAGETIEVIFTDRNGLQLDVIEVLLTNEPADAGKNIFIEEESADLVLSQNMPNPFSDFTTIQYQIPKDGQVEVALFSLTGSKITTLVNEFKPAGKYEVIWDGRDEHGNKLSPGMYVYMLKNDLYLLMKKLILIR
jgi:hypothetical protein